MSMLYAILLSVVLCATQRDEADLLPDYRWPNVCLADAHRFRHVTREEARYHTQLACARWHKARDEKDFNFAVYVDASWRYDVWNYVENVLYIYKDRDIRLAALESLRWMMGDDFYAGVVPASVPD